MALGTFTPPPTGGKAGSFDPRYNADKPLIVVPREFRPQFVTQRFPKPKDVVICDVVDVGANVVHVSVIWGAEAIVDHIKGYVKADGTAPEPLPVKIITVVGQSGNAYGKLVPLDGAELDYVAGWDAAFPGRIDAERAAKIAADAASATPAPAAAPMWGQAPGATQAPTAQPQWAGQVGPVQNYAPPPVAAAAAAIGANPQWNQQPVAQPQYQPPAQQPAPVQQWAPPPAAAQPQYAPPAAAPQQFQAPAAPAPVAAPPAFDVEAAIAGLREQQAAAS